MLKKIISISLTMAVMGWPMGSRIGWAKGKAEDPVAAAEVIKLLMESEGLRLTHVAIELTIQSRARVIFRRRK
jgi:hypothetical protein